MSSALGKTVTVNYTTYVNPFMRQGEIVVVNSLGKKVYSIVLKDSNDNGDILDEDLGNCKGFTIALRRISKYKLIRKIQVIFYRLKFKIQK